jgi:multiple sugar transport system permease protein
VHAVTRAMALNSPWALMVADSTILLPFTMWFLKSGIDNIPVEIEEAGAIDGARLWKIRLLCRWQSG